MGAGYWPLANTPDARRYPPMADTRRHFFVFYAMQWISRPIALRYNIASALHRRQTVSIFFTPNHGAPMTTFTLRPYSPEHLAQAPVTLITSRESLRDTMARLNLDPQTRQQADTLLSPDRKSVTLYRQDEDLRPLRTTIFLLDRPASPHLPEQNVFALRKLLTSSLLQEEGAFFIVDPDSNVVEHAESLVAEIVRAFPRYSRKTGASSPRANAYIDVMGEWDEASMVRLQSVADTLGMVAELVDTPTLDLDTESFARIARQQAERLGMEFTEIPVEVLKERGFGGLYHVGKSGIKPPRLVIVKYRVPHPRAHLAIVGKGLVYDTGGLCLKPREHMSNMKSDMAGAAAALGALCLAAETHLDCDLTALLCLAENGIGPEALRPDDIITLYSGKTVEINNTDAEGRLVLADGVAYASRHLAPDYIVDIATLTGAQLMCTGKRHAGLLTPSQTLQDTLFRAGRACGEPVFPMLYAPELLMDEFRSDLADMKNSCKDRLNAQSSCAGHFVEAHLAPDWHGGYAHIDIAGPAWDGERATAYGSLLLDTFARHLGHDPA